MELLPCDMIREVINFASFEVFCAFALTSKYYLEYCRSRADKFIKKIIIKKNYYSMMQEDEKFYHCFPNNKLHGYSNLFVGYFTRKCCIHDFGRLKIKAQEGKDMCTDIHVILPNGRKIDAAIKNYSFDEQTRYALVQIHYPNVLNIRADLKRLSGVKPIYTTQEGLQTIYDDIANLNVAQYIKSIQGKFHSFSYKLINKFEIRVTPAHLSIAFKDKEKRYYNTGHVEGSTIHTLRKMIRPEIFAAMKPWFCPEVPKKGPKKPF